MDLPRRPRFASEVRLTSPLPDPASAHTRLSEFLSPDDDESYESSSLGLSSSSGPNKQNAWLIAYLTRTWKFAGAAYAIDKYGEDLIVEVASLLDEMIRLRHMSRPHNPGAYLRRCLDWALATRDHAEVTPVPVVAPTPLELPSGFRVLRGGKEAAS